MPVYSVPITIYATAYVKADDNDAAWVVARSLRDRLIEIDGEIISDKRYDDPTLPEVSISLCVTIGEIEENYIEECG